MLKILLKLRFNVKNESEECLDNPLPNYLMFLILLPLRFNVNDESIESVDNPLPNS